ncbi:MAG: DNA adenine methylase [Proteobacteria bacterium]|nr:DNA adenine methylase [Pseudomonadota bacterium]MDE3208592.1 DNA adenine methylase [Pseudomonadota bacterium]
MNLPSHIKSFPKPFVKWAGGKRQLLNLLSLNLPPSFTYYFEPFVGGGAFLFSLLPEKAVISDLNPELINAYWMIRDNVEGLISDLRAHHNEQEYFYRIRKENPGCLSDMKRASRFIYLNKTCFNGLYRENSRGQFNVPFGRYTNPNIVDEENLRKVSNYLNNDKIIIKNQNYIQSVQNAGKGDFIYFDPPYHPISLTSSFTRYTREDFNSKDQEELAQLFHDLAKKGCFLMLSNSNTGFIKDLYRDFVIMEVNATRFVNCKPRQRGKAPVEILVKNF